MNAFGASHVTRVRHSSERSWRDLRESRHEIHLVRVALAILGPLSEGEARWMAGIIAEVLKDALPKAGQRFERWSVSVDAPVDGSQSMGDVYLDEPMADAGSNGSSKAAKLRASSE
jgi:hypothetical protein